MHKSQSESFPRIKRKIHEHEILSALAALYDAGSGDGSLAPNPRLAWQFQLLAKSSVPWSYLEHGYGIFVIRCIQTNPLDPSMCCERKSETDKDSLKVWMEICNTLAGYVVLEFFLLIARCDGRKISNKRCKLDALHLSTGHLSLCLGRLLTFKECR